MNYTTLWQRFAAIVIDILVILPPIMLLEWLQTFSKIGAWFLVIPLGALFCGYTIYCHGRFGQTIGKHLMKIRVVRMDGERISWREARLRSSVDAAYAVVSIIAMFFALAIISDASFYGAGWPHLSAKLRAVSPVWLAWVTSTGGIWGCADVIVMLFNKQRRALHDFIAGTVVVAEQKTTVAQPQPA